MLTVNDLIDAACKMTSITRDQFTGESRHRYHVRTRQTVFLLASRHGYSSCQIGRRAHRDHSTVLHGIKQANILLNCQPGFRALVDAVEQEAADMAVARKASMTAYVAELDAAA